MNRRLARLLLTSTVLVAIAGAASAQQLRPSPARPAPAKPAPPAPTGTPSAISEYLTLDINTPANYARPVLPAFFANPAFSGVNTPRDNPITDKGATLGRVLFHDKRLSVNNTTSCATCHQQALGFGAATRFSRGFLGDSGTAHTMRLSQVAYYRGNAMFWDKRAPTLEAQSTQPIQNSIEMGYDLTNGGFFALLSKMQNLPYYPPLFTAVFGDASITEDRIQRALAQYMRSMVSAGSRWDQAFAQVYNPALPDRGLSLDLPGFTAQENAGRRRFMGDGQGPACSGCHQPPSFALTQGSRSNGLDAGETRIFKAPSLKMLAQGQPMMHDGRFTTFEQVVAHYNQGVRTGPALDNRLKTPGGQARMLNLNAADQAALVAFLKTLDDPVLKTDARFANPFRK